MFCVQQDSNSISLSKRFVGPLTLSSHILSIHRDAMVKSVVEIYALKGLELGMYAAMKVLTLIDKIFLVASLPIGQPLLPQPDKRSMHANHNVCRRFMQNPSLKCNTKPKAIYLQLYTLTFSSTFLFITRS